MEILSISFYVYLHQKFVMRVTFLFVKPFLSPNFIQTVYQQGHDQQQLRHEHALQLVISFKVQGAWGHENVHIWLENFRSSHPDIPEVCRVGHECV